MEFAAVKKNKNRKRRRNTKNKRRITRKFEVTAAARRKVFDQNISAMNFDQRSHNMEANTFWENYKVAQEWQQRHSVAWWKSRCHALERENRILRQKVRSQASSCERRQKCSVPMNERHEFPTCAENGEINNDVNDDDDDDDDDDSEKFEFQVDKGMLEFLEQSIRHKMELKRVRESEIETPTIDSQFVTGEARNQAKIADARLLYGDASPRIMAMEAALQATVDRHKDRAKPHYWPNIPLKP